MHGIRGRLQSLVSSVAANPMIRLERAVLTDPLPGEELNRVLNATVKKLPAGVRELYEEVGSFELEWVHADGFEKCDGAVGILPIDEVLGDWEDVTWHPGLEEFRPVIPFDKFLPEACAAFWESEDGSLSKSMFYHEFGEELYDTGYSFEEYIERLVRSRGYCRWQATLCHELQDTFEVKEFRANMPRLFSDYDDSLFQPA